MEKRQWLVDIRCDRGFTHEEAAELADVDRTTYTKAENGYPIGIKSAKKIAAALGFDWTFFYGNKCDDSGQSTNSA